MTSNVFGPQGVQDRNCHIAGDVCRRILAAPELANRKMRRARAAKERRAKPANPVNSGQSLGRPGVRGRIAEAVHRAVCEFSGTDGCGHCMLYAVGGAGILGRVFGRTYHPQAGSMAVLVDPPDLWMTMDATNFSGGEFHCWLGRQTGGGRVEMIDFASRHYRAYWDRLVDASEFEAIESGMYVRRDEPLEGHSRPKWNREAPPDYVWTEGLLSEWLRLVPDRQATEAVWSMILGHLGVYEPLVALAVEHYQRLGASPMHETAERSPAAAGQ
ncbi:hypothetical protein [Tautonia plasticadhaerens]|uniref:Uncharacterized protein n=1 Tax=Tautonia plasticadhaerens TaxID=2527974 RepID=A0A518HA29_9BACT|nr:hypothetical protein [Tautonia plasticadhaerens]QDV37715.1 hypothetical protein ElP_56580 [Tautonia plasticadhaerens]